MTIDPRCCGSGTCIVDAAGRCWCGQQWDGEKMCNAPLPASQHTGAPIDSTGGLRPAPTFSGSGGQRPLSSEDAEG